MMIHRRQTYQSWNNIHTHTHMYTTHKHSHLLLNWSEQFFHNKAMSFSNGNSEQCSDQYQFPAAAATAAVTVAATQSSTTEVGRFCRLPVEDVVDYFHTRYHRIFPRAYAFLILPVPQMMTMMTRRRRRRREGRAQLHDGAAENPLASVHDGGTLLSQTMKSF